MINFNFFNKILILLQIGITFLYFYFPFINIFLLFILMFEFIFTDSIKLQQNLLKNTSYTFYIFIKFFICFVIFYKYPSFDSFFLIVLFQTLYVFFDKNFMNIYRKKINSFYSSFILILSAIYIIYFNNSFWNLFLLYPLITLILLHIKAINVNKSFCSNDKKDLNLMITLFQNIPLSFFTISSIFFISFFYLVEFNLINKIILSFILIVTIYTEIKEYKFAKSYGLNIFQYYLPSFFTIFCIISLYWISNVEISDKIYKDYTLNIFSSISSIAILNIASLFVILQLNYNKYGSSFILFKIIKSPILFIITFLPSLFLILNFYVIKDSSENFDALPTLFLTLSYGSTFMLFIYTYFFMETNFLINKLFKDIKYDDLKNYKKNIIQNKETNIDSILIITTKVINNNDTTTSHSLFFHLFCWVNRNIYQINSNNGYYRDEQNNMFNDFFNQIINQLIIANNNVLHENFIDAVESMLIRKVNTKNFTSYKIVYAFLFNYLNLALRSKNQEIANSIYRVIYMQCPEILMNMNRMKLDKYEFIRDEDDRKGNMFDFESTFIRPLSDTLETAIKNSQIEFMSNRNFFDDMLIGKLAYNEKNDYSKWDAKVFEVFSKLRSIRYYTDRYVIDKSKFFGWYLKDFETLFPYHNRTNINYMYSEILLKYVFVVLRDLFNYAIENEKIKSDLDFEILWSQIFEIIDSKDEESFKQFVSLFTFLFDKLCVKYLSNEKNHYIVKLVYLRIIQIQLHIKGLTNECKKFIDSKVEYLEKTYPELIKLKNEKDSRAMIRDMDILEDYNIIK
jgi:hypothetical protein